MILAFLSMEWLWRNALAAVPIAVLVALLCRLLPCRPSTKHSLWLIVLLSLLAPPLLPQIDLASWISEPSALNQSESPATSASRIAASDVPRLDFAPTNQVEGETLRNFRTAPLLSMPSPTLAAEMGPVSPIQEEVAVASLKSSGDVAVPDPNDFIKPGVTVSHSQSVEADASIASLPDVLPSKSDPAPAILPTVIDSIAAPKHSTTMFAQWREWFQSLIMVRDALVNLTPIPASFWFGGCGVIVVILIVRTLRFRHVLRNAMPAPSEVNQAVKSASRRIGLRTPPQTLMSEARISPMICCGRRRVLLLPVALWGDLDDSGRNAVLLHELAHLRRRDHWVRWMDLIIGCLYWWHPVVWFVRKRLRDEADHCCDAWVTALLPAGRTAYARALLSTRQFIDLSTCPAPVISLGMANNRTKQFARRLTMVMTERNAPRMSVLGGAMAICVAAAAWLTTPLWACPPDSNKDAQRAQELAAKARMKAKAPRAVVVMPRSGNLGPNEAQEGTTFEAYMADRERQAQGAAAAPRAHGFGAGFAGDGDPVQNRLDRLEERLNRLTEQLERMAGGHGDRPSPQPFDGQWTPRPPRAPAPPSAPAAPAVPSQPLVPGSPMPPMAPSAPSMNIAPGGMGGVVRMRGFDAPDNGELISRVYKLSDGKREDLYELMARSDVPVHVSSQPNGILVVATARQHEIFGAFVRLIDPSSEAGAAAGGFGSGSAKARKEVEAAQAVREAVAAQSHRQAMEAIATTKRAQVEAMRRQLDTHREATQQQIRELKRQAEEFSRKARELEKQSSKLQSQADDMEEGPQREELLSRVAAMESEAEAFESQSQATEDQLDAMQDQMESLADQLEQAVADAESSEDDMNAQMEEQIEAAIEAASGYDAATESDNDGDR